MIVVAEYLLARFSYHDHGLDLSGATEGGLWAIR